MPEKARENNTKSAVKQPPLVRILAAPPRISPFMSTGQDKDPRYISVKLWVNRKG